MKKIIRMILCILILSGLLCGCGKEDTGTKTYTCENLTITVPASMKEQKDLLEGTGFQFCLEGSGILVVGLREDLSKFSDMTAMEYANQVVQVNNLNGIPEDKGDYVMIEYTEVIGTEYTYVACIYKNGYEFWTVQAATLSSVFDKKEAKVLEIVTSAQID